jgi:peptide/nickel transport system substrate-binding protein
MKSRRGFLLVACLMLALGLGLGTAKAADPDTVTYALPSDLMTLDPQMHLTRYGFIVGWHIFDNLVYRDPETAKIGPHLATSWKVLDELTWEFKLRTDVVFHNGEKFDATTVKYNLDRLMDPEVKSPQRGWFGDGISAEVVDKATVRIKTKKPFPILLERFSNFQIVPEKYTKEKGAAYFSEHPVGTGPYKFVRWARGQEVVVEMTGSHFRFKPAYKRIVFRVIPDASTRIAELLSGGVDIIRDLPPDQIEYVNKSGVATATSVAILRVAGYGLDMTGRSGETPLKDKRVRQAINHAVDVEGIIKHVLQGRGLRLATSLNPLHFGYDSSVKPYPYDPERAKKLLAEAGYAKGFKARFLSYTGAIPGQKQVAEAIAADLAKVGIEMEIQHFEDEGIPLTMIQQGKGGPMWQISWGSNGVFDAEGLYYDLMHSSGVWSYVRLPELDKLIERARTTLDARVRTDAYAKAQQIVKEEAPWLFLYAVHGVWGVSKRVEWKPQRDEFDRVFIAKPAGK